MFRVTLIAAALLSAGVAQAAGFAAGDLVVYRVGTGSASLTSAATQVFLDEYTTAGVLVQSVAMPTVVSGANGLLTASGTASSEGELSLSTNGQYVLLTGYNAAAGTAAVAGTSSSTTARTVGVVNVATGAVNTTTKLTDFSTSNNPRSVASTNGSDIWVGGAAGGVRYTTLGASTSTQLSTTVVNIRQVSIFNGQLFASDSSGTTNRLGTVGANLPTTAGQTITNLPGFATSTGSPYSFFFADLSSSVAGLDTLYVADDAAGITKYSLNAGTWVAKGTVGAAADTYRGLTGSVSSTGVVSLFATGLGGTAATGGGKLVTFADNSGYNGTLATTATTIATAITNEAFRGVAYIPAAAVPEADTSVMLIAGLGLVGFATRRRNK